MGILEINNLNVNISDRNVLNEINIYIENKNIYFLLGRNGAGKSTFSQTLMGNPNYKINSGDIIYKGENINSLKPEERINKGLFVSFQHPPEIEGVSMMSFLHSIYIEKFGNDDPLARSTFKFRKHILNLLERVNLKSEFLDRSLNVGFSGGEKKRSEILQMLLLKPELVILDEVDSGLDVHAQEILQNAVNELVEMGSTVLYITHNVDFVKRYSQSKIFLLQNGSITKSGGQEVIEEFIKG